MNFFWLDASACAKRYIVEEGTPLINYFFRRVPLDDMFCLLEGVGEIISVIVRSRNRGTITTRAFNQAKRLLNDEIVHRAEVELVLPTENQISASWGLKSILLTVPMLSCFNVHLMQLMSSGQVG